MGHYSVRVARVDSIATLAKRRATTRFRLLFTSIGVFVTTLIAVGYLIQRPDIAPRVLGIKDARAGDRTSRLTIHAGVTERTTKGANGPESITQTSTQPVIVTEGDRLRTKSDAMSEVRFPTGQVIRLNGDSEIEILRIGVTQSEFTTVVLRRGQVWLVSPLDQPTFELRTLFAEPVVAKGSGTLSLVGDRTIWGSESMESRIKAVQPWDESLPLIAQRDVELSNTPVSAGELASVIKGSTTGPEKVHATDAQSTSWWKINKQLDVVYWQTLRNEQDQEGPDVSLNLATTGTNETKQESVVLEGETEVLADVMIGDQHLTNDNGHFQTTLHLSMGENTFTVRVKDRAGNTTEKKVVMNRVDESQKKVDILNAVTMTGIVEEKGIRLSWSENRSTSFREYTVLRSQLHDDPTLENSSNLFVTKNRAEVGYFDGSVSQGTAYTYRICVTGTANQAVCSNVVKLTAYRPGGPADVKPTAKITLGDGLPRDSYAIDESITFDGSSSFDDKSIVSYLWDFGDGNVVSQKTVTHAFTAAGTYVVTLTVVDDSEIPDHWDKETITIVVE